MTVMTGHVKAPAVAALATSTPSRAPKRLVFQSDEMDCSVMADMGRGASEESAFRGMVCFTGRGCDQRRSERDKQKEEKTERTSKSRAEIRIARGEEKEVTTTARLTSSRPAQEKTIAGESG